MHGMCRESDDMKNKQFIRCFIFSLGRGATVDQKGSEIDDFRQSSGPLLDRRRFPGNGTINVRKHVAKEELVLADDPVCLHWTEPPAFTKR